MALLLPRRRAGLDIADVFSTDLRAGTNSSGVVTNGIDLSGEGGLVWVKQRDSFPVEHQLFDTNRGALKALFSNDTAAESTQPDSLTSFNSDGFSIGSNSGNDWNNSGGNDVFWTFRKSPYFFDVVTYAGNGTAGRPLSHNLGVAPGLIICKRLDLAGDDWCVYHRSVGATGALDLNNTNSVDTNIQYWNDTEPTDSVFTLGSRNALNQSGFNYIAYVFAHDDSDNGVIQCGSYTGNGSTTGPTVTLGWEPQWVMIKTSSTTGQWVIMDNQRVFTSPTKGQLFANLSNAEGSDNFDFLSTGFQPLTTNSNINGSGATHIYIAIRKEGV